MKNKIVKVRNNTDLNCRQLANGLTMLFVLFMSLALFAMVAVVTFLPPSKTSNEILYSCLLLSVVVYIVSALVFGRPLLINWLQKKSDRKRASVYSANVSDLNRKGSCF